MPVPGAELPAGKTIRWRLLCIGADPAWFESVRMQMSGLQPDWELARVANSTEAIPLLAGSTFDVLIFEDRISDVSDLLATLGKDVNRYICLVRCDISDEEAMIQWNSFGVMPVSGGGDAAVLRSELNRTVRVREWTANPAVRKLLPQIRQLPAVPRLHALITKELESPEGSMQVVARLVAQDPVMSAKILQVANSAALGVGHEVTDMAEAVLVLGAERIRSLILLAGVFSQYDRAKCPGFSPESVWGHSVQAGMYARTIALKQTGDAKVAEAAFTAGLLHDVGKLILAANVPRMYEEVLWTRKRQDCTQGQAERLVLGTTHAELGACLLASWGLPLPILEAIAWHDEPEWFPGNGFTLVAAVHVANALITESNQRGGSAAQDRICLEYLNKAGLGDIRNRWRSFCGLPVRPDQAPA